MAIDGTISILAYVGHQSIKDITRYLLYIGISNLALFPSQVNIFRYSARLDYQKVGDTIGTSHSDHERG